MTRAHWPRIAALDLSLRATGYADEDGARVRSTRLAGMERLARLRDTILGDVEARIVEWHEGETPRGKRRADLVVIEDYAFSRGDAHAHALGELGGVVKLALHELGIPTVLIGPSAVKKFATNKGNCNKTAMGIAAAKAGYDGPDDDNAVDAWWLYEMAMYRYLPHDPSFALTLSQTAYRDEAVAKIDWPKLPEAVAT